MAIEDVYDLVPIPQADELSLGVPPPPQAPALPPMSQPVMQQGGQKALSLATLAAMITGGPNMAPLGRGVLQGQQMLEGQRQQADREQRLRYDEETQAYRVQQMAWQQQMQQRQKLLNDAVVGIRKQVEAKAFKSKDDYDAAVEQTSALLQNYYGMRVSPNYFRQAAKFSVPTSRDIARSALDELFKNPETQRVLAQAPDKFYASTVDVDLNGDDIAEPVPVIELLAQGDYKFLRDENGKPMHVSKEVADKPGTPFQEKLMRLREQFRVDNNDRPPTPAQDLALQEKAAEKPPTQQDPVLAEMRQLRLEQMKNAPQASLSPQAQRRLDSTIRAYDALPIVKKTQTMAEAVSFADSLSPNTTNPADDQALIYAFAKAMDPDSVVREGEYATVQKYAQSWAESFGFNAARVFSNTSFLTPQARSNMKRTIRARYQAARAQYDNVTSSYATKIDRITGQSGTGREYLTDYEGAFPSGGATGAAPVGAPSYQDYLRQKGAR
jgi:hypothetical protein